MTIKVLRAGACDLVMDQGRAGFAPLGVPVGGAADRYALAHANRLVGNPVDAAGLEITLHGPVLAFPHGATVALSGAPFALRRSSGKAARHAQALQLEPGEELGIGAPTSGCRCWLAVRGGIDVAQVLGSRSTFLPSRFGGFAGRALRASDTLALGSHRQAFDPPALADLPVTDAATPLRVIAGPQAAAFNDAGLTLFFTARYRVNAASDRRGLRLSGAAVAFAGPLDSTSQAVLPGAIQIPPDGQPIILGWDGPVTGGYPVIAGLISADLPRLAQLKPGDSVHFATVSVESARELARTLKDDYGT
jgi:biotin-dependent carboxylase-like uncharacterized protein